MSGPSQPRSDRGAQMAEFLRSQHDAIVSRWSERVAADPLVRDANHRSRGGLRDHIPGLVDGIATALERDERPASPTEALLPGGEHDAREHGAERFREGYSLTAALRELSHLREAIVDVCDAGGVVLDGPSSRCLRAAIDDAMCVTAAEILRAAEQQAIASEARYRFLVESVGEYAIMWLDPDGNITSWNAGVQEVDGYTADEVIGKHFSLLYTPEDRARNHPHHELRLAALHGRYEEEAERVRKDGTRFFAHVVITAARDAHGELIGFVDIAKDVTQRRRTEQALREREADFRMLADNITQLAWMADSEGTILWFNQRWYEFTGLTPEASKGFGLGRAQHPDHVARVAEGVRRHAGNGEPWEDSFPMRRRDGEYRWFLARAVPMRDDSGRVVRWFGTATDVTEQRLAHERLRLDAELRERFIGVLSHDIRSPLSAVVFTASSMLNDTALPPRHVRGARRILKSGERMQRMVHDLLDLTRSRHGGGIPVRPVPLALRTVCEDAIEELHSTHPDRQIELVALGGCQGNWDPDRIAQAVNNLLGNALMYSPADSTVRVEVGGRDAHSVFLRVQNSGTPIPAETLPMLFDAFKRPGEGRHSEEGLGLGLYIVAEIVRAHGGAIEVSSTVEEGTSFTVTLPRDR